MREIKFRAWDGSRYIYFDNHQYDLVYNDISGWNVKPNIPNFQGEWVSGQSQSKTPDFVLEQFTGLHDKNGKEIYEGDVVDWLGDKGVVVFHLTRWAIRIKSLRFPQSFHQWSLKHMEVIGTVHENQELLTK